MRRLDNEIDVYVWSKPIRIDLGQAVLIERCDGPIPVEIAKGRAPPLSADPGGEGKGAVKVPPIIE